MSERRQSLWLWFGLIALGLATLGLMGGIEYWEIRKIESYVEQKSQEYLVDDFDWISRPAHAEALSHDCREYLQKAMAGDATSWDYGFLHRDVAEVALKRAQAKAGNTEVTKADVEREYPAEYASRLERFRLLQQLAKLKETKAGIRNDSETFEALRQKIESLEVK